MTPPGIKSRRTRETPSVFKAGQCRAKARFAEAPHGLSEVMMLAFFRPLKMKSSAFAVAGSWHG
ncbi:hypothetical protein Mapa_016626 [Marchantia paleacea]|nr:hypothetical protein Mapa_016626 [Marchantia paleacea]